MTKKIMIIANDEFGLYRFRKDLISKLSESGNDVLILCPTSEITKKIENLNCKIKNVEMERRSINPIKDFSLLYFYIKQMKSYKPDIMISYTIKPNIYGSIACKFLKIPYICNITGLGSMFYKSDKVVKLISILYKFALSKCKLVFFENSNDKDIFVSKKIISDSRVFVLNGAGVNLDEFKYLQIEKKKYREFLFMSRIMKEKGVDELFDAIKNAKEKYGDLIKFVFIGSYEENYEETVNKMVSNGYIEFFGSQNDVVKFIKHADSVILPSYHEGMSNTLLEGAASGRILVTSNICGCKEAVLDGITGFLIDPKNSKSIYRGICNVMDLSDEQLINMSLLARKHIESKFDKKLVVNETIKNINRVI